MLKLRRDCRTAWAIAAIAPAGRKEYIFFDTIRATSREAMIAFGEPLWRANRKTTHSGHRAVKINISLVSVEG